MTKYLVIAGHGQGPNGWDPGAHGNGWTEADFLREVFVPAMKKYAPSNMDFKTDQNVYAHRLAGSINGYDEIIELHLDAAGAGAEDGHVIIYSGYKPDAMDKRIRDVIDDHVGADRYKNGFSYRNNLYNLNVFADCNIGYRLVELAFITHKEEMDYLKNNYEEYAADLVAAIVGKTATVKKKSNKKVSKPKPKSKPKANLTVDGKWGSASTKALQIALGTVADGILSSQPRNSVTNALYGGVTFGSKGSLVIEALQRLIGEKVDGKLGPGTIRSLQQYLGTPVDGVLSRPSLVIKELQRRLNSGTL